ncbi:hypothetical protein ACFQ7N_10145 [Streptomyces niveus]|uniref:hypothetical protein n=1 Tax=Streptomyces niveus TaxID=193462 RepID=UPI0036A60E4C
MSTELSRRPAGPTCPPGQVGPCARCHQPTHRYGHGANPLCPTCRKRLREGQGRP